MMDRVHLAALFMADRAGKWIAQVELPPIDQVRHECRNALAVADLLLEEAQKTRPIEAPLVTPNPSPPTWSP